MKKQGEPQINESAKEDFTKVVFQPNLKLFKMHGFVNKKNVKNKPKLRNNSN